MLVNLSEGKSDDLEKFGLAYEMSLCSDVLIVDVYPDEIPMCPCVFKTYRKEKPYNL